MKAKLLNSYFHDEIWRILTSYSIHLFIWTIHLEQTAILYEISIENASFSPYSMLSIFLSSMGYKWSFVFNHKYFIVPEVLLFI